MVTAFVVGITLALILFIGLILDGGYTLAARREAIDEADGAARAATQAVGFPTRTSLATGIDPGRAEDAVARFLGPTGHSGTTVVSGDTVTVTVSFTQPMYILGAAGLVSVRVTGRGTAHAVRGVGDPAP